MGARKSYDGIFTRKDPKGNQIKDLYISYTDAKGKRVQQKLKGVFSVTEAKKIRAGRIAKSEELKRLLADGYIPPTKDTFSEIVPRYLKHQNARLTEEAFKRSKGIVENHLTAAFGTMPLGGIRRQDVQKYITDRLGAVSTDSVIKEVNVLKHLLGLAVEWELIPKNPAEKMGGKKDNLKPSPSRVRYLQPTELRLVLASCPRWLRPIAELLVYTGMRRGEVLGLRWLDVDLEREMILLPQTKNGDGRIVHLNDEAIQVLKSLRRGFPNDPVFRLSVKPEAVTESFRRACLRVGIENFRLHDLRHTAASWMRMSGSDLQDVADQLGHRDLRMTRRYANLSAAHRSAAVKRMGAVLGPLETAGHDLDTIGDENSVKPLQTGARMDTQPNPLKTAV
jgi:integrase